MYVEADLISCNVRSWSEMDNLKKLEKHKESFSALTLSELEAGFVVCLVPLAISILVFLAEWMVTVKNLVVFLFIFTEYFELKESEQKTRSARVNVQFAATHAFVSQRKKLTAPETAKKPSWLYYC